MSMTFWAPDAPTTRVVPYPDEPDYVEEVSTLPELNLSNSNAFAFLSLLGLPCDYGGTIEVEQMPQLCRDIIVLMNSPARRAPVLQDYRESQAVLGIEHVGNVATIQRGARFVDFGLSDDQVMGYCTRMLDLLQQAQKNSYRVCWG